MAQGRVAHLIEWKGWCKPIDTPAALESDFNSYSDLTEGEQEARFAAGKKHTKLLGYIKMVLYVKLTVFMFQIFNKLLYHLFYHDHHIQNLLCYFQFL